MTNYEQYARVLHKIWVEFQQQSNGNTLRYVICDCHVFVTVFCDSIKKQEKVEQKKKENFELYAGGLS